MCNSVSYINRTSIFEWYVVRYASRNGRHKDVCLNEIGLCAHNMLTILGSIINIIGGDLCDLWTLIIHSNSRLAPYGIDYVFF